MKLRSTLRTCRAATTLFVLLLTHGVANSEDAEDRPEVQRAAHLARMKDLAASIHVYATPGDEASAAKLIPEPVLRYSDETRRLYESSLWIWGSNGRPSAIAAIEFYPNDPRGPRWLYEIASLSTAQIAAVRGDDLKWTAKEPGLKLQRIAAADAPAARPIRRLAQMKELRGRFAAHERAPVGGRIELRPLTSPLFRYKDEANGLLDGAIFSFANGTNPEVLLALEAHETKDGAEWRYALVQMTGAAVAVQLDGKDVWDRGDADPPAVRESYVNGWIASEMPKE